MTGLTYLQRKEYEIKQTVQNPWHQILTRNKLLLGTGGGMAAFN